MTAPRRYAVYWAPERDHPLWAAGSAWLGRDAERPDHGFDRVADRGVDCGVDRYARTVAPRRYGFHATLKAPMHLGPEVDEDAFFAAVETLAATVEPFPMPTLHVATLQRFVALRPRVEPAAGESLRVLADRCVTELDRFRAPSDRIRLHRPLDDHEEALTRTFGYAYVLERWRFHMTLSDGLPADDDRSLAALVDAAESYFGIALATPLAAGGIAVFVEPAPDAPFDLVRRFPFGGKV